MNKLHPNIASNIFHFIVANMLPNGNVDPWVCCWSCCRCCHFCCCCMYFIVCIVGGEVPLLQLIKLVVLPCRRLQGVTGQPRHSKLIAFGAVPSTSGIFLRSDQRLETENFVRPSVRASARPSAQILLLKLKFVPRKSHASSSKKYADVPGPMPDSVFTFFRLICSELYTLAKQLRENKQCGRLG